MVIRSRKLRPSRSSFQTISTTASENHGAWIEGMKRYNKDIAEDI